MGQLISGNKYDDDDSHSNDYKDKGQLVCMGAC